MALITNTVTGTEAVETSALRSNLCTCSPSSLPLVCWTQSKPDESARKRTNVTTGKPIHLLGFLWNNLFLHQSEGLSRNNQIFNEALKWTRSEWLGGYIYADRNKPVNIQNYWQTELCLLQRLIFWMEKDTETPRKQNDSSIWLNEDNWPSPPSKELNEEEVLKDQSLPQHGDLCQTSDFKIWPPWRVVW